MYYQHARLPSSTPITPPSPIPGNKVLLRYILAATLALPLALYLFSGHDSLQHAKDWSLDALESFNDNGHSKAQQQQPQIQGDPSSSISHSLEETLRNTLKLDCSSLPELEQEAIRYPHEVPRTALASFPRSGNSYTRSLVERATGFQSSSLYCDKRLLPAFKGECDGIGSPFLVKTHWPFGRNVVHGEHWKSFDRALRIVRNPLDMMWSDYHMAHTDSHTGRVPGLVRFNETHKAELSKYLDYWLKHAQYWEEQARIPVHTVRYEDLRSDSLSTLLSILSFLLPFPTRSSPTHLLHDEPSTSPSFNSSQPTLARVLCAIESDPSKDPYKSRKSPVFDTWDHYEPEIREWALQKAKKVWCRNGYDLLLKEIKGIDSPVDCKA